MTVTDVETSLMELVILGYAGKKIPFKFRLTYIQLTFAGKYSSGKYASFKQQTY